MKILSTSELLCLTRFELIEIARSLSTQLATIPDATVERYAALQTLSNIRIVLQRLAYARRLRRGGSPSLT